MSLFKIISFLLLSSMLYGCGGSESSNTSSSVIPETSTGDTTPPKFTSANTFYVNEGELFVGDITTDDSSATLSLGANSSGVFELKGNQLSFIYPPDYEEQNIYSVTIVASDTHSNTSNETITVNIIDLEEVDTTPPKFTSANTFYVNEGELFVGDITTDDSSATLSLGANSSGVFELKGNQLSFIYPPDYEEQNIYSVTIVASDTHSNTSNETITVNIIDLEEVDESSFVYDWFELFQTDLDFQRLLDKPSFDLYFKNTEEVNIYYIISDKQYAKTFLWSVNDSKLIISYASGVEFASFNLSLFEHNEVMFSDQEETHFLSLISQEEQYYEIIPSPILQTAKDTSVYASSDREDRENITFLSTGERLQKGVGWCYDTYTGVWFDFEKIISCNSLSDNYVELKASLYEDYIDYQFKNFEFENELYTTLIVEDYDGYYTYPNLKLDWNITTNNTPYIFESAEYDRLHRFLTFRSTDESQVFEGFSAFHSYDEEVAITTALMLELEFSFYFTIKVTGNDNDIVVRYRNPSVIEHTDENFSNEYFEIDYQTFYSILLQ